ncbi:MAG: hypothetical protein KDA42_05360 [Planctomycetales bacterium]|nr:hypothetical protein [Planctomycetales bacterium]
MQIQWKAAVLMFALGSWATMGLGQDAFDLFSDVPETETAAPADPVDGQNPLDDVLPPDPVVEDTVDMLLPDEDATENAADTSGEVADDGDASIDDLLSDGPVVETPVPAESEGDSLDDLLSDEPPASVPTTPSDTDLFPGSEDSRTVPSDDDVPPLFPLDDDGEEPAITSDGREGNVMEEDAKGDQPRDTIAATESAITSLRPYYSANGTYDRVILFDRHRVMANPALPYHAIDGRYTAEVLNNDPQFYAEDQQRHPNMWPWRVYYSYPNWTVPFTHREFGGPSGLAANGGLSVEIDWKRFARHQLLDFRMRKRKAEEVNSMLANDPGLNRRGHSVDWQENSWSQMHDVSKRLEYTGRLKEMGVSVDYRKYTPEQLLNFLSRVRLAQELDKMGHKVNWRLYSWRQLHDLLQRVEEDSDLMGRRDEESTDGAEDSEVKDLFSEAAAG